jgi:hypothetical protein
MPRQAVIAGLASALMLAAIHYGLITGILVVPLLPLAPLAWSGFMFGVVGLSAATLISLAFSILLLGPFGAALALVLQLFPAWIFFRELLKLRLYVNGTMQWQSPGGAFLALTMYAVFMFGLLSLMAPVEFDRLLAVLEDGWQGALSQLDPSAAEAMRGAENISHLALAFGVWMAAGMCYAAACLGNFTVLAYRKSVRPSLALQPYQPPAWLFGLFLVTAVLSLMDAGRWTLMGQMLSLILLLPYFISGLSLVHMALRRWQYSAVWISGFYVIILMTLWPVLFLAAYGLTRQCLLLFSPARAAP